MWRVGGLIAVAAGGFTLSRLKSPAALEDVDWRRTPSTISRFTTKLSGLLRHTFTSRAPIEKWENDIATRPGLIMHPRVSKLAQSAADGVILEDLPRVYAPGQPLAIESLPEGQSLAERDVFCVWHFGSDAVGHPTIVHGGAIAMAFDESFGHAFMSLGKGPGFTAFLNVNYRKPLPTGSPILIKISIESISGRKVFLNARLSDGDGLLFADARALFVVAPAAAPAAPAAASVVEGADRARL